MYFMLPGPRIFWYFFVPKKVQIKIIVLTGIELGDQLVVLTGKERGGAARPLICFFFLINFGYDQNLSKNPPG